VLDQNQSKVLLLQIKRLPMQEQQLSSTNSLIEQCIKLINTMPTELLLFFGVGIAVVGIGTLVFNQINPQRQQTDTNPNSNNNSNNNSYASDSDEYDSLSDNDEIFNFPRSGKKIFQSRVLNNNSFTVDDSLDLDFLHFSLPIFDIVPDLPGFNLIHPITYGFGLIHAVARTVNVPMITFGSLAPLLQAVATTVANANIEIPVLYMATHVIMEGNGPSASILPQQAQQARDRFLPIHTGITNPARYRISEINYVQQRLEEFYYRFSLTENTRRFYDPNTGMRFYLERNTFMYFDVVNNEYFYLKKGTMELFTRNSRGKIRYLDL
jgi:hypothetical protein